MQQKINLSQFIDLLKVGESTFQDGVSLFLQLSGKIKVAETMLRIGDNSSNRSYLYNYFQQQIANNENDIEELDDHSARVISPEKKVIDEVASDKIEIDETIRNRFIKEWQIAYRERGHLHGRLHQSVTKKDRFILAKLILKQQKEIDRLNVIKFQLDQGIVPGNYLKEVGTAAEYVRIKNLKYYIQRYERKLKTESDPNRQLKYKTKIANFKKELETY